MRWTQHTVAKNAHDLCDHQNLLMFVSKNQRTPNFARFFQPTCSTVWWFPWGHSQSSIYRWIVHFIETIHPFWGTPMTMETPICFLFIHVLGIFIPTMFHWNLRISPLNHRLICRRQGGLPGDTDPLPGLSSRRWGRTRSPPGRWRLMATPQNSHTNDIWMLKETCKILLEQK